MLDIRDSVKERSGTLHDQNDFSERGRKFIDGQFDFQVKTHQFEVKNLVKQLSQVLVYGTLHDYDKEDPILKLCIQTPHSHKNPDKNCYSCSKTGGDDITCNYCGYKSCKDCTQKKRPYPGQPIQQQQGKQKLLRGIICKVCERKFQLGVFHARETSIIVRNEEQINQLNQNLKAKQATLEGVKKECNDIKSQMMKIDNDQVNFQERIKIDIEKLEDLVVAQETTIQRTENKINDLIQQNEQSKIEKKNQEENIKQLKKQEERKNEEQEKLEREYKLLMKIIQKYRQIEVDAQRQAQQTNYNQAKNQGSNSLKNNQYNMSDGNPNEDQLLFEKKDNYQIPKLIQNTRSRQVSQNVRTESNQELRFDTKSSSMQNQLDHFHAASLSTKDGSKSQKKEKKVSKQEDKKSTCKSGCQLF
eukprot:403354369